MIVVFPRGHQFEQHRVVAGSWGSSPRHSAGLAGSFSDVSNEESVNGSAVSDEGGSSRVLLHVGLPKTGTTFVQRVIWGNRENLTKLGWGIPGELRRDHNAAANGLRSAGDGGAAWKSMAETADDRFQNWVISEEALAPCTAEEAALATAAFAGKRVEVLVTVRDLGRALPSAWQQNVKERRSDTFEELLTAIGADDGHPFWNRYDVVDVVRRWMPSVGAEQTSVMVLPPSGGDVWDLFASEYGWPAELPSQTTVVRNESLGVVEAEVLRRFNEKLDRRLPMNGTYFRAVRQGVTPDLEKIRTRSGKIVLPAQFRSWVEQRSEEMISQLTELGVNIIGNISDLRPTWHDGQEPSTPVSAEEALEAMTEAFIRFVRRSYIAERDRTAESSP